MNNKRKSYIGGYTPAKEDLMMWAPPGITDRELGVAVQLINAQLEQVLARFDSDTEWSQEYQNGFNEFGFMVDEIITKIECVLNDETEHIKEMYFDD